MRKEKQIEEMAKIMARRSVAFRNPNVAFMTTAGKTAESLYNADYRKQEWIRVEERFPDEQGHFLIVDKEGQMNTAFYTPRFGWFSHFRIKNITHWMPLPEAPKGGAE